MSKIVIGGIEMTKAAAENVRETGIDPLDDVDDVREGRHTEESLLDLCLDGAADDRVDGWRDYVAAVVAAASVPEVAS